MTALIGILCGHYCDREHPCEILVWIDGDGSHLIRGNDVPMFCPQDGRELKGSIESIMEVKPEEQQSLNRQE